MSDSAPPSAKSGLILAGLGLVAVAVVAAAFHFFSTIRSEPRSDWTRRDYAGLSLELPGTLRVEPAKLSPEDRTLVTKSELYRLEVGGCDVRLAHTEYASSAPSVESAVNGTVEALKKRHGAENVTSTSTSGALDGVAGTRLVLDVRQGNIEVTTETLYVARGREIWIIGVAGEKEKISPMARRIFASAKWKS